MMMSGGTVSDGRLWWAVEGEFELAEFDQCEFDEQMDGPAIAVVDGLSFGFQMLLYPKGAEYEYGEEVRDHMGVGISVAVPVCELSDFKFVVKVYKADGSLELKTTADAPATMGRDGWHAMEALPIAPDKLKAYVLVEEGSEFVRVRVELGIPPAAFDALSHLPPPAPRQDLATQMLDSGMTEAVKRRIDIDMSNGAVEAFISFLISGSVSPTAIDRHVLVLLDLAKRYHLPDLKRLCERAVVKEMQLKKLPVDFLDLLKAAKTYNLRVAFNVGLCRLLKAYPLSAADKRRFSKAEFAAIRDIFMKLSCDALRAIKC